MAIALSAQRPAIKGMPLESSGYVPGACNIGPAEIARRRRAGHLGLLVAAGLLAILVAIDVDPLVRLLVALPAAAAASGYLQARLRFCAAFGFRGIMNFGPLGRAGLVVDRAAAARDRRRAAQIASAAAIIGLLAGLVAVLLPL